MCIRDSNYAAHIDLEEVENIDDIYDFALRGSMVHGKLYGIPRIACRPVLFYRSDDKEIEEAKGILEIFDIVGGTNSDTKTLPKGEGLFIDLTGSTTCAALYLDSLADSLNAYSVEQELPASNRLDGSVVGNLRLLTEMAGIKQATSEKLYGKRAGKFAEGYGRIMIGWTERLAKMPKASHDKVKIRRLPLADDDDENLMFVDTLVINSTLTGKQRELAIKFANFVSSAEVVAKTFLVTDPDTKSPQYLLPVRNSFFEIDEVKSQAAKYTELKAILDATPRTMRLPGNARIWLARNKDTIQSKIIGR